MQKRVDEADLDAKIPLDDEPNPDAFTVSPPGLAGRLVSGATTHISRNPKPSSCLPTGRGAARRRGKQRRSH